MGKTISIGIQDFEKIVEQDCFYVDKTDFIKEWWENGDDVTLITRPRRFGKTLTMSMIEKFFSAECGGRSDLFSGFKIWREQKYRDMQGTYPVIFLSFANIKGNTYKGIRASIIQLLLSVYADFPYLYEGRSLNIFEKEFISSMNAKMDDSIAIASLNYLSRLLSRYYNKKVIILLDEYDAPMQEAYMNGCWEELSSFMRGLFNATFKSNRFLARAVITGITRVSKESIFFDLNNLVVVTSASDKYAASFGFTEKEVYDSLKQYGMADRFEEVKEWYDGFTFGNQGSIYNPWSIINYLEEKKFKPYWVNTSSNALVSTLIKNGSQRIKQDMELLLRGEAFKVLIDEEISFSQLECKKNAVWSLLLASGYLKVVSVDDYFREYELALTNKEVYDTFATLIHDWFDTSENQYNEFIRALLQNDVGKLNRNLSGLVEETISFFDKGSSFGNPENFYHGLVLGLIVDLKDKYVIRSNRESGYGRYDVLIESKEGGFSYILEFKVASSEEKLQKAAESALWQIKEKRYDTELLSRGIPKDKILYYGIAFKGKKVFAASD